jgi:hypothetical protein
MGKWVCGYLMPKAYSGCTPVSVALSISGTLPAPADGHDGSITWFSNAPKGNNPNGRTVQFKNDGSGHLQLYV